MPETLVERCQKKWLKDALKIGGKMPHKVDNILKGSLDSIPSPLVKIQIMGRKICLRCKGNTVLGIVNKLLKTESLLTSSSNVASMFCLINSSKLSRH